MGSAFASSGSLLELAGTGSVGHRRGFEELLTEAIFVAPHYQNVATVCNPVHSTPTKFNVNLYE